MLGCPLLLGNTNVDEIMSKYLKLSELACKQVKATFSEKEECEQLLHQLIVGYIEYLDIPRNCVKSVKLNKSLDVTEVLDSVEYPKAIRGLDSYWYFAFQIYYTVPSENVYLKEILKLGAIKNSQGFIVKTDSDTQLPTDYKNKLESVFLSIYESDRNSFQQESAKPQNKIGFV